MPKLSMTLPAPKGPKMVHGTWPPSPPSLAKQKPPSIKPQAASTREYGKPPPVDPGMIGYPNV